MATVRVDVAPKMLEWAVRRVGWDEDTASQKFPSLDAWLRGEKKPTLKQLQAFAKKTHAPFGQLFLDEPPVEEVPIPDMRTVGNQRLTEPSPDLLDTIYLCQLRQDWYRDYGEEVGFEELLFVGGATTKSSVVQTAEAIRKELKFGVHQRSEFSTWEDALRYLLDAIENLGVLVMVNGVVGADTSRRLDPDEFRGFALADSIAPLIFINGADTKAAQIFTLIHELAHLRLGNSALSDATMARQTHQPMELWCNQVAAEVLVPIKDLRADYAGQPDTDELQRLARTFRVSTLVVLKRIFDLGGMTWDDYQRRYQEEKDRVIAIFERQKEKSSGGDFYKTQRRRLSPSFIRAVYTSTMSGETSFRDGYELLGTRSHETFMRLGKEDGPA